MEVLESLHGNVVCALAAGIGDYVRCTLLEYSYHDGQFWIFTEGGEKFIGLERNKNVSLAVFEKPPDFGALKSVLVMDLHICNRFVRKKMKNQNCAYFRNNFLL